jgi:hypothetical protein
MATDTVPSSPDVAAPFGGNWRLGLASGIAGGIAFGLVVSVVDPAVIRETVPALYGVPPPGDAVLGWVLHTLHATVFGVAFAAVIGLTDMSGASSRDQVGAALVFSLGVWVVFAGVAMPLWLSVVSDVSLRVPYLSRPMLAGHLVYGTVMGAVYYAFDAPADDDSGVAGD